MIDVRLLTDQASSLAALKDLAQWAAQIDLAYAWATSAGGTAPHWRVLPLGRLRRAIIGIHFAQTEPYVLRELDNLGVLRVVADTDGVFHPKVIVGVKGKLAKAIVGSSNLTSGGFAGNTEVNVYLEGSVQDDAFQKLLMFIEEQWSHPRASEPDEAWFEEYERLYDSRPRPPKVGPKKPAPLLVQGSDDLDLDWSQFVAIISRQEQRALWNGWTIHVFDHPNSSYLQEIEECQAAFTTYSSFARMPEDDRKLVAGWGPGAGYCGRMLGAGYFKNLSREHPSELAEHLDRIPLTGPVTLAQARMYLSGITQIRGVALGAATRLLCMKRPDLFLPANNASLASIRNVFGTTPNTIDKYLELTERIWGYPWFLAPRPEDVTEQRLWAARVALLDAVFYEPPEYLR